MADLKSKRLIIVKGVLFLACIGVCSLGLWIESPHPRTVFLLAVLIWSSARFYYFLFYVLHQYVDPRLKYAGLSELIHLLRRPEQHPQTIIKPLNETDSDHQDAPMRATSETRPDTSEA